MAAATRDQFTGHVGENQEYTAIGEYTDFSLCFVNPRTVRGMSEIGMGLSDRSTNLVLMRWIVTFTPISY